MYSPTPIKVTKFTITNRAESNSPNYSFLTGSVQAGNDNSAMTTLNNFTNSTTAASASWDLNVTNTKFYKYYKIIINTAKADNYYAQCSNINISATYMTNGTPADYAWASSAASKYIIRYKK